MEADGTVNTPERIERTLRAECMGCRCCEQICPSSCIHMAPNSEGFLYPKIDASRCQKCMLCAKTCPVINVPAPSAPRAALALMARDDLIRRSSSSGGVCTLLARNAVENDGIVYGAAYNEKMELKHIAAERSATVARLSGSKYVQSDTRDTFSQVRAHLRSGRYVMYTGTPCQIAGLKAFLGNEKFKGELLCVDLICHGVPSPEVFRRYVFELSQMHGASVTDIRFRDKTSSWKQWHVVTAYADGNQTYLPRENDTFLKGFLTNLYLRPCCYSCKFKGYRSGSDLLVGDFWNVRLFAPRLDDDKGLSLAVILSNEGNKRISEIGGLMDGREIPRTNRSWNSGITDSVPINPNREAFFKALNAAPSVIDLIKGALGTTNPAEQIAAKRTFVADAKLHGARTARKVVRRGSPR